MTSINFSSLLSHINRPNGHFLLPYLKSYEFSPSYSKYRAGRIHCSMQQTTSHCDFTNTITRRSGNYKPSFWDYDFIQALNSQYSGEKYLKRASELKMELVMMLEGTIERVTQLEFIDDLQRLGISYHFYSIIKQILATIHAQKKNDMLIQRDLYTEALEFRILRQHGFEVSQEIFDRFKDDNGEFKSCLSKDAKGLVQLYEAAYLLIEGESTLEQAREFATVIMHKYVDDKFHEIDRNVTSLFLSVLELPLHWRIQRPNARSFINTYEKRLDVNHVLLEFAKLDFNILQAMHQEELKDVSRWWKRTELAEKLPFARDRVVECYFWTIGGLFEPQCRYSRIIVTKVNVMITIIDDIYDVYGTLEELQLFSDAIERWDMEDLDKLPGYMQVCFLALNNLINDIAYDVLKDQGFNIIPYLRKSWKDLCGEYLQEAKWYYQGYTPTTQEYMNHAWISISVPVILSHSYFTIVNPIDKEAVHSLYAYHDLIRWSGIILRLADDLGTSLDEIQRGDVPKMIQCYMNETGATEKDARGYAGFLMHETWKKMNKERVQKLPFPGDFIRFAVDIGRMAHYMYQHGDGHGIQNLQIIDRISSILFESM